MTRLALRGARGRAPAGGRSSSRIDRVGPSATIRPSSMRTTRPETSATIAMSWVLTRSVSGRPIISAHQLAAPAGVEAGRRLVEHEDRSGPSRGRWRAIRACADRGRDGGARAAPCPPCRPTPAPRSTRAWSSPGGTPMWTGPKATSSPTVGLKSWSSGSWKTSPTRAGSARAWSARPGRRRRGPRRGAAEDAVEVQQQRRLARAVRPHERDLLTLPTLRSMPRSASVPSG